MPLVLKPRVLGDRGGEPTAGEEIHPLFWRVRVQFHSGTGDVRPVRFARNGGYLLAAMATSSFTGPA